MKKKLATLLILITLGLTACSGFSSIAQVSSTQESTSLPTETELVVGTLKLDGTQQTVTIEQAKDLLFLWKAYRALYNSDTTAQVEIDALVKQIQETMTTDQMKAISAMNLTQPDVLAVIQEQGVQLGSSGSNNASQTSAGSVPPDGGGMAAGAPPDSGMGGMVAAGQNTSSGQSQAGGSGSNVGISNGVTTALVEVLIQSLEQRISA